MDGAEAYVKVEQTGGRSPQSEVAEFVDALKGHLKEVNRGSEWIRRCEDLLEKINQSLDPNVASGEELLDIAGSCDLLEVVVRYVGISKGCEARIVTLIGNMTETCDPREMFTVFFEAINMYTKPGTLHLCIPLLHGLSIVFRRIKRRQAEFFKEATPGLLDVCKAAFEVEVDQIENESEDELIPDSRYQNIPHYYVTDNVPSVLIDKLVNLGNAMREVCSGEANQRLYDVLVLYILRLLGLVSSVDSPAEGAIPRAVEDIMKLMSGSKFYMKEILSTRQLEEILQRYEDEDEGRVRRTRFEARRGAALSVYWCIHNKDTPTATLVSHLLKGQIEISGRQSVSDIINMASLLLVPFGWKQELRFQQKGLTLINSVLEVSKAVSSNIDPVLREEDSVQIIPALKRIQDLVVHTPNSSLRKDAYALLIKAIRGFLPASERYQALHHMISNCDHPSLVSLLLTCVKDEVANAWPRASDTDTQREAFGHLTSSRAETLVDHSMSPFVSSRVLQFIQCVLRGRNGNSVELPRNIDAVVGALNLYRFLLIRESSGKTNYTHVLSYDELVKARTYWLLPIREEALRVISLLQDADSDTSADMLLGINCLLSVLYRSLEIVEQILKDPPI